jgi:hypothetical protein
MMTTERLIIGTRQESNMDNNGVRDDPALVEALISSYSILSLLHHRGLVDSQFNRDDVAAALTKLEPFAKAPQSASPGLRKAELSTKGQAVHSVRLNKLRITAVLELDPVLYPPGDEDAQRWLIEDILIGDIGRLTLHSNEIGGELGYLHVEHVATVGEEYDSDDLRALSDETEAESA